MGEPIGAAWHRVLAVGEEAAVATGPVLLLGVIAAESTGLEPARITLKGSDGATYCELAAPANDTVWAQMRVALPGGLSVACGAGQASVMVSYV